MIPEILFSSLASGVMTGVVSYALGRTRQINHDTTCQDCLHDALTGLGNRRMVMQTLDACGVVEQDDDQASTFATIMIDLDKFKQINDTHGHEVGDRVLVEVGRRLGELCAVDIVGRLSGDEFAVITGCRSRVAARMMAASVHATLVEPMTIDGLTLTVGASLGVVLATPQQADRALKWADRAMYQAKFSGGGVVELVIDQDVTAESEARPSVRLRELRAMEPTTTRREVSA